MNVACFCGHQFETQDYLVTCPSCREPCLLPRVSGQEAERMYADLEASLAEIGVLGDPGRAPE